MINRKLISPTESRIHGDVYVRFGGRYGKTYRRKATRRSIPSLLMPQTLGENAEITIAYSTVYGGGEVFNGEKKVSLKDVVWGAGDKILYTLLLPGGAENVTFTPDVTNWNTQTTPEANEAQ